MAVAVEVRTKVLPGHRIEIEDPGLPDGRQATVFVVLEDTIPKRPIFEVLKDYPGRKLFQSAKEVDDYLKEERESWDR